MAVRTLFRYATFLTCLPGDICAINEVTGRNRSHIESFNDNSQTYKQVVPMLIWARENIVAGHDNVAVQNSGACVLSHQPFPYRDIWDPLRRVFDASGLARCLWGTDWTRAVKLLT